MVVTLRESTLTKRLESLAREEEGGQQTPLQPRRALGVDGGGGGTAGGNGGGGGGGVIVAEDGNAVRNDAVVRKLTEIVGGVLEVVHGMVGLLDRLERGRIRADLIQNRMQENVGRGVPEAPARADSARIEANDTFLAGVVIVGLAFSVGVGMGMLLNKKMK